MMMERECFHVLCKFKSGRVSGEGALSVGFLPSTISLFPISFPHPS